MIKRAFRLFSLKQYSLSTQMSIALGGLTLVFIALTGLIITLLITSTLEGNLLEDRHTRASHSARLIENLLHSQRQQILYTFDYQLPPQDANLFLQQRLREAMSRDSSLLEMALVAPDGTLIASERRIADSLFHPFFKTSNARWLRLNRSGQDYMSSLRVTEDGLPYVIMSLLIQQPSYQGYSAVARVDMREIQRILSGSELERNEILYVVDTSGHLIASTRLFPPLTPPSSPLLQPPYRARYINLAFEEVLGASVPIADSPWIAVNEFPTRQALEDIDQTRISIALLTVAGAILALVSGRVLARQIISPLRALATQTEHLQAGDYQYRIGMQAAGEIGALAQAFNRLGEAIAERELDLRTTNMILKDRSQELAALSRQIIAVEEEERRRISREIHDGFGQTLAALKMSLDVAQSISDPQRRDMLLRDARTIIEQAIDEAHTISQNLRPTVLDDLGLVAALDWYLRQFSRRFEIAVQHELNPDQPVYLTSEGEITAFRFVQEALSNVHKHAQATEVSVKLRQQANFLMVAVKDNGKGFNYKQKRTPSERVHLGLSGMRERLTMIGGELVVHSLPGIGTTLIALVPMQIDE